MWGEPERVQCGQILLLVLELEFMEILVNIRCILYIRESVDSLCRDGADAQYMQYLSKSRITSPQIR